MQLYSCGFLFDLARKHVLLIRKRRPTWQAGKLNGVGGKVEPGETPLQAMIREFREEAGVEIHSWEQILTLRGSDWEGHFFRAFADLDQCRAMTDELLEIHEVAALPQDTIPNLHWMIPLMLDQDVIESKYTVEFPPCRKQASNEKVRG